MRYSPVIFKIIKEIEHDCTADYTIKQLAHKNRINPDYLGKLFKKEVMENFNQYLNNARIAKSRQFLENTGMKIADISRAVGYDNVNYFSTLFKNMTKMTPQEYRSVHTGTQI